MCLKVVSWKFERLRERLLWRRGRRRNSSEASLETTQQSGLAPAQRRLSSCAANPMLYTAQLAVRDVLPRIPITSCGAIPVLVAQECIGSVSQAVGAAAGWLTAHHPLANEMDPLAVLRRDAHVPKWTKRLRTPLRSMSFPLFRRH